MLVALGYGVYYPAATLFLRSLCIFKTAYFSASDNTLLLTADGH